MKDTLTGHATVERSEGETIRRAHRGDAVAFECLYKAQSKRVYSVRLRRPQTPRGIMAKFIVGSNKAR
jgi:hypothetical protein